LIVSTSDTYSGHGHPPTSVRKSLKREKNPLPGVLYSHSKNNICDVNHPHAFVFELLHVKAFATKYI
jgi:hypothetical protein